jgi:hypothetical protein
MQTGTSIDDADEEPIDEVTSKEAKETFKRFIVFWSKI